MTIKILQIYNQRKDWGGEDYMVESSVEVLRGKGHEVDVWIVRNGELMSGLGGKVRAFFSGIYSFSMKREMRKRLQSSRPDVVHAHNLYPLFSASVLVSCSEAGVPVVMHCHNHFLTCPIGTHLRGGSICEECTTGSVFPCVRNNCRGNMPQSIGYALRAKIARLAGWFRNDVSRLILLTQYAKDRLMAVGFPSEKMVVLPNVVFDPEDYGGDESGSYIVYVGRLSPEKGASVLMEAALQLPDIQFRVAGDGPLRPELMSRAPRNVSFHGWLDREQLSALYRGSRIAVVPSICFETFGLTAADAMIHGVPVIASRLGGLAEVIDDGETGLLFGAGDSTDLARKIRALWNDPGRVRRMSKAACKKARKDYSSDAYYAGLSDIYSSVIDGEKRSGA